MQLALRRLWPTKVTFYVLQISSPGDIIFITINAENMK